MISYWTLRCESAQFALQPLIAVSLSINSAHYTQTPPPLNQAPSLGSLVQWWMECAGMFVCLFIRLVYSLMNSYPSGKFHLSNTVCVI